MSGDGSFPIPLSVTVVAQLVVVLVGRVMETVDTTVRVMCSSPIVAVTVRLVPSQMIVEETVRVTSLLVAVEVRVGVETGPMGVEVRLESTDDPGPRDRRRDKDGTGGRNGGRGVRRR